MRSRLQFLLKLLPSAVVIVLLIGVLALWPSSSAPTLSIPLWAQGYSNTNPYAYFVPPGACNSSVSANSTGTNGLTTSGTSGTPVIQASTSATGTNTQTYVCNISPPNAIITTNNGIAITDAVFFYGISAGGGSSTAPTIGGVQVATLGSGTMNSSTVFAAITYPAPGIGETATTVAPVRADTGTLLITPVVASFNAPTTTAGAFYAMKFTPAAVIAWKTDLKQLLLTVTIQAAATTATITQSPGVLVHFRGQ